MITQFITIKYTKNPQYYFTKLATTTVCSQANFRCRTTWSRRPPTTRPWALWTSTSNGSWPSSSTFALSCSSSSSRAQPQAPRLAWASSTWRAAVPEATPSPPSSSFPPWRPPRLRSTASPARRAAPTAITTDTITTTAADLRLLPMIPTRPRAQATTLNTG